MTDSSAPKGPNLEDGVRHFKQGNNEEALAHLSPLANSLPVTEDVVVAMYLTGTIFRQFRQFDASLRYLNDSVKHAKRLKKPELEKEASEELEMTIIAIWRWRKR